MFNFFDDTLTSCNFRYGDHECLKKLGYTNVLKIDLKCPEKYIKAYIFFIIQWIEFKFGNAIDISIYLKNILGGNNLT